MYYIYLLHLLQYCHSVFLFYSQATKNGSKKPLDQAADDPQDARQTDCRVFRNGEPKKYII